MPSIFFAQFEKMNKLPTDQTTRAYLALAAICIIWGTTYTAIKYAIRDFPPYLLVGLRQTAAGLLLLAVVYFSGKFTKMPRRYLALQALTGVFTITGGNGFITWGMQYIPSGLAAVIGSLTPVMVVIINLLWHGSEKTNWKILVGVLLGFGGLGFVFREGWADFSNPDYRLGIACCFASCFSWSLGTVMAKRFNDTQISPLQNAGYQLAAGGIGAFLMMPFMDKTMVIHHTWEGWTALIYCILIGSALAFSFYMYALKHLSATVSSLYTYINPVVAIILGWIFLHEKINPAEGIGMAVTIFGVWLVNLGYRQNAG